jgi:hypothetical protein
MRYCDFKRIKMKRIVGECSTTLISSLSRAPMVAAEGNFGEGFEKPGGAISRVDEGEIRRRYGGIYRTKILWQKHEDSARILRNSGSLRSRVQRGLLAEARR